MRKRVLIILLAIFAVLSSAFALSACGSNENTDEYDEILKFIPYGDNAYAVTAVETEHLENIVILAKYRNKPVTRIATKGFNSVYSLVEIVIPDSVTSIGDYAFSGCNKLTRINIPDSVKVIDDNAFYNCSSLTSVTIGNGVTSISSGVFNGCSSLSSVTIPDRVTSIGSSAFYGCSSLSSVTIPDSVTNIESFAFAYCNSLTSITIPASVTSIGGYAFYGVESVVYAGTKKQFEQITKENDDRYYTPNTVVHCSDGDTLI